MNDPEPSAPAQMAEAFLQLSEVFSTILDTVDGHRAEALERGYSAEAAEAMAVACHAQLFVLVGHHATSGAAKGNRAQRRAGGGR